MRPNESISRSSPPPERSIQAIKKNLVEAARELRGWGRHGGKGMEAAGDGEVRRFCRARLGLGGRRGLSAPSSWLPAPEGALRAAWNHATLRQLFPMSGQAGLQPNKHRLISSIARYLDPKSNCTLDQMEISHKTWQMQYYHRVQD